MKKRFISLLVAVIMIFTSTGVAAASDGNSFLPPDPFQTINNIIDILNNSIVEGIRRFIDFFAFDCDFIFSERFENYRYDDITILDDGFVPQGLCRVEALDCFAISGYMDDDSESRIYLDNGKKKRTVILKGYKAHAGGIASYGDDIYVCSGGGESSNGRIYRLKIEDIKDIFNNEAESVTAEFSGSFETYVKASFLGTDDNDRLFVGEFYNKDNKVNPDHKRGGNSALAYGYDLPLPDDAFDGERPVPSVALSIPDQVQGMAVKSDGDVVFSTSYGRRNSSYLQVFERYENWEKSAVTVSDGTEIPLYISDKSDRIAKMNMPTLMEGIVCDPGGLYCIFESGANKYSDAREINSSVVRYDIDRMISLFR